MVSFIETVNYCKKLKNPNPTKTRGQGIFSQEVQLPSREKYSATAIGFNINHIPDCRRLRAYRGDEEKHLGQNSEPGNRT